jgi:hypothetical protein
VQTEPAAQSPVEEHDVTAYSPDVTGEDWQPAAATRKNAKDK